MAAGALHVPSYLTLPATISFTSHEVTAAVTDSILFRDVAMGKKQDLFRAMSGSATTI